MAKNTNKRAFTLVELMLAVAFLGTLLLSIAMLTMQLINIYTKGATMRAVNSTGSAIMRDIRTTITSSESRPANLDVSRDEYFYRDNKDNASESKYGAFCTGSYTYIWNYRDAMIQYRSNPEDVDGGYLKLKVGEGNSRPYALARVKDSGCQKFKVISEGTNKEVDSVNNPYTILLDGEKSGEGTDLALYDFSVITATRSTLNNKGLYDISFVLGTMTGNIDVSSSNNYCKNNSDADPDSAESDYEDVAMSFCSVNRFEFVVRQSGLQPE